MTNKISASQNYDFADSQEVHGAASLPIHTDGLPDDPWKILVVDDDEEVHRITRIVLGDSCFEGRRLLFLHSYSVGEALESFQSNPDIAVALVDVVMETDDAGLLLVERVRNELGNSFVRLILRTGQAGLAPERDVVVRYDINDYKEKTELSSEKLYTTVISALRSYRDIVALEAARKGMERMVAASEALFGARSIFQFTGVILAELIRVMGIEESRLASGEAGGLLVAREGAYFVPGIVCSAKGSYAQDLHNATISSLDRPEISQGLDDISIRGNRVSMLLRSSYGDEFQLEIEIPKSPGKFEISLLELFRLKANAALERLVQLEKAREAQRQAIRALAKIREQVLARCYTHKSSSLVRPTTPSIDILDLFGNTGGLSDSRGPDFFCQLAIQAEVVAWGNPERAAAHILRVSRYSYHLGKLLGEEEDFCVALQHASRLHDIGSLFAAPYHYCAWSEANLESRKLAEPHATEGRLFLSENEQGTLLETQLAIEVAHHHHEAWNGSGYPGGLAGEDIPLSARIVAVADFFDTTTHHCASCDKPAVSDQEALEMLSMASRFFFDPKIVGLFIDNLDLFFSVREEINRSFFSTQHER